MFIDYMKQGKFDKSHAKDIFSVLLDTEFQFSEDDRRHPIEEVLDSIISDPRFRWQIHQK